MGAMPAMHLERRGWRLLQLLRGVLAQQLMNLVTVLHRAVQAHDFSTSVRSWRREAPATALAAPCVKPPRRTASTASTP